MTNAFHENIKIPLVEINNFSDEGQRSHTMFLLCFSCLYNFDASDIGHSNFLDYSGYITAYYIEKELFLCFFILSVDDGCLFLYF